MIQSYVLLGTLGVHSIEDIRKKEITLSITLFSGVIGALLHLFYWNQSIYTMLMGMLPGVGILILSRLTEGRIGLGDGIVFMLTGFYLGIKDNLLLMCISFLLAGIWGVVLLLVGHCGKNRKIPFVPFLFVGYILMMAGKAAV